MKNTGFGRVREQARRKAAEENSFFVESNIAGDSDANGELLRLRGKMAQSATKYVKHVASFYLYRAALACVWETSFLKRAAAYTHAAFAVYAGPEMTSAGAVICVPCKDAERWLQLLWNPAHWARFCLAFPFPASQSLLCPCSIIGVEQQSLTNHAHSYYRTATARASKMCDWRQLSHIILASSHCKLLNSCWQLILFFVLVGLRFRRILPEQ